MSASSKNELSNHERREHQERLERQEREEQEVRDALLGGAGERNAA